MPWTAPLPDATTSNLLQAQDELIYLLANDSAFTALYNGQILTDDPLGISDDDGLDTLHTMKIALTIAGEGDTEATLGGRYGTTTEYYHLALMVYLFDDNRDALKKRQIANITPKIREIIKKYRPDINAPQRWYTIFFRDPTTTYHTTNNFRQSITMMTLTNRVHNL